MTPSRPQRSIGVWMFTDRLPAAEASQAALRIEAAGYRMLWVPETSGRDPFAALAALGARTSSLGLATGIANISHRHPASMWQAACTLAEQTEGRFVLGLGVSHSARVAGSLGVDYSTPLRRMRTYLLTMADATYTATPPSTPPPRILAALGPKMLELAAELADGAHPYLTTPEHTEKARAILGADPALNVEQMVVRTTDRAAAHAAATAALSVYRALPNYRNNWLRLGFSKNEIEQASPRLLDALVAWGTDESIADRVRQHLDAGADHICVQALDLQGRHGATDVDALVALAPALLRASR